LAAKGKVALNENGTKMKPGCKIVKKIKTTSSCYRITYFSLLFAGDVKDKSSVYHCYEYAYVQLGYRTQSSTVAPAAAPTTS